MPEANRQQTLQQLEHEIYNVLGSRITAKRSAREAHSEDEAYHRGLPDLVVFPHTTAEVAFVVEACRRHGVPLTPWGAGTSLEGNALVAAGGLCLDMSEMCKVLDIRPADFTARVEAGVKRDALNAELKGAGLYFSVDPGANATLGGMASTRASGTSAVRYGTMRENVLSCTVVLANGQVVETRRATPKSAAGYDLTGLIVGAEGTLGVITELTVRLHPLPEAVNTVVCIFPDIDQAVDTVVATLQYGMPVARIELLDAAMMRALNAFHKASYSEAPTLFVEFHGIAASVAEHGQRFEELVEAYGGRLTSSATRPEERSALWRARHSALYATRASRPGYKVLITDVCVPISKLAACIRETRAELDASPLAATIAGHVGDGNFHAFILVDPACPRHIKIAEEIHHSMARRAISMGGTCSGEHGIGKGKRSLLALEAGAGVEVMRAIKDALDPTGILNPGKIFV